MSEKPKDVWVPAQYVWLPEAEQIAAVKSPDRANLIVAAAVELTTGWNMVLIATGDGRVRTISQGRFGLTGASLALDLSVVRPADGGRAVVLNGTVMAAADALCGPQADETLFDPTDFDGTAPDAHATPDQLILLDQAVAILNRVGDGEFDDATRVEWRQVTSGLRASINLYGSEWIHRGWDLVLHGSKMLTDRWTPETAHRQARWWEAFLANPPKARLVTRRIPTVSSECLKP